MEKEITKVCTKCNRELPISEFYKNEILIGGYFNVCKECYKKQCRDSYNNNLEKQRERGREKYHRLYAGKPRTSITHPEGKSTRRELEAKGIDCTGFEVHHWNYNFKQDVFLLPRRPHKKVHTHLTFDKKSKMFFYKGTLLTTKDNHERAIKEILEGDDYKMRRIDIMVKEYAVR